MSSSQRLQAILEELQKVVPPKLLERFLGGYGFRIDTSTGKLVIPANLDPKTEKAVIASLESSISTFFGARFWKAVLERAETLTGAKK